MATADTTSLDVASRPVEGSRAARRLRRSGLVPGVVYGSDAAPLAFSVDARILRNTLAHAHAVIQVALDGATAQPVIVKDLQRHPVRGQIVHVDLLRVNMDVAITSTLALELVGAEAAPGVIQGGILNQEIRELTIEALPGDIPDSISFDVSTLDINETVTVSALTAPTGVRILDEPDAVVATVTPPTIEPSEDEIETETEVIGDAAVASPGAQAQAEGATADDAASAEQS